ncbi:transglutaminase-like cysteine peptidase [Bradyrhizobium sp. AUGA SZCCT0274]|nr:transglutaminase-like cysteine peptidase [Bradyrhizobium sp. AUGA SZCCT0274]
MIPRLNLRKLRSSALIAALTVAAIVCAASPSLSSDEPLVVDTTTDFIPGSDRSSARPPATFFSINAVLAKLDRQRGRGPDAIRLASLPPSNTATDAPPAVKEVPTVGLEPFGLFTFRAPDGLLWRKWRGVEAAMAKEQAVLDQCRSEAGNCPANAAQFLRLIGVVSSKSGRDKLEDANRGVNAAVRYVSDYSQHGEADRWSTPLATFATARGDCEDYAIAKYVALAAAGFSRNDLQLVLVRDRAVRQDHAVLAARLDGRWLILDNRHSRLIEDSDASSFTPLFAINQHGVHLFAAPYARRPLLTNETEASPAAADNSSLGEWTGTDNGSYGAFQLGTLPLLM